MKPLYGIFLASALLLASCYGNPEQHDENIGARIQSDSDLIPVDSTRRDKTETTKGDTFPGKTGRVNGL